MTTSVRDREIATATWEALGTTALVRVDDGDALGPARTILEAELAQIDLIASRFRPDSELERVNARAGHWTPISPQLHEAIAVAMRAAALTGGCVDPALGAVIALAGYDRDWRALDPPDPGAPLAPPVALTARRVGAWRSVELRDDGSGGPRVRFPAYVRLDLGATAKALAADRAANAVAAATGAGTLVSLGGDIATAGPAPDGGWAIHVTDDHRDGPGAPGQTVAIEDGGLATSSTTARRWRSANGTMHHILDPRTGTAAAGPWRTVSVTAASCVDANIASTAAIVLGADARAWLDGAGLAARLVSNDGRVLTVGGWPEAQR